MFWSFSNILCSFWTFDVLFGLSTFWFLTFWPFPELLASITSTFNFYEPYLTSEWPHDDDGHSRWQPQDQACGRGHPRLPQALPVSLHITQGRIQGIWKFDFISLNCNCLPPIIIILPSTKFALTLHTSSKVSAR